MVRNKGSNSYDSYWCYGGIHWPPSTGSSDRGGGKVGGTLSLEFGVLVLPSPSQLMRLQKSDPIFRTVVDIMKPVFNLDPKYRVTMLTREEWTRRHGAPPAVKELIWSTDGSRTVERIRAGLYGQSADRRLSISLRKHATVIQAEVYAILACVHETETQDKPEKNVGICSESQGSLKVLKFCQKSPLVRQCQEESNNMSIRHTVGLYWVPGHAGVRENEIANKLARGGSVEQFVGPEPFLGVSRQNIRGKKKCWMEKQHLVLWHVPCDTQRQAQDLISGPDLATRARLLSFKRTQSRVVICLLTGHNTLRRHLCIMGLRNNPHLYEMWYRGGNLSPHFVCVRPWLHSDIHIWVPSFWTLRILGN